MAKLIDLSVAIENNSLGDPPAQRPVVEYIDHDAGAESMVEFFEGATKKDLPDGKGWAVEYITLSTHSGTHMDSPYHYHPTMDGGKRAWGIDEIPLEWCFSDGVKFDFSDRPDGHLILSGDFKAALRDMNYALKPGDIVLVQSGAAPYWGTEAYIRKGCGMGREATLWLLDQGVHIVGTDAWSWDPPLLYEAANFSVSKDKSLIWEGHLAGIEKGYFQMEKLTNLDKLPNYGFKVFCHPIKLRGCSGGWVRPVAMIAED